MSEFVRDPGITMPFSSALHLFKTLPIIRFHIDADLKAKLHLDLSNETAGSNKRNFSYLGLMLNRLYIDIGQWYLMTLKISMNV